MVEKTEKQKMPWAGVYISDLNYADSKRASSFENFTALRLELEQEKRSRLIEVIH